MSHHLTKGTNKEVKTNRDMKRPERIMQKQTTDGWIMDGWMMDNGWMDGQMMDGWIMDR